MKTILEYLNECKEMAWHNRLCYSANYAMTKPKAGYEVQYSEAVRDCEIVDELLTIVQTRNLSEQAFSVDLPEYATTLEEIQAAMREIHAKEGFERNAMLQASGEPINLKRMVEAAEKRQLNRQYQSHASEAPHVKPHDSL